MKVSKLITLDVEIIELLKREDNASALINSILREYYDEHGANLDEKIKELKQKSREIKKKMRLLKQKQLKNRQNLAKRIKTFEKLGNLGKLEYWAKQELQTMRKELENVS